MSETPRIGLMLDIISDGEAVYLDYSDTNEYKTEVVRMYELSKEIGFSCAVRDDGRRLGYVFFWPDRIGL